jgi:tellurite resistance protein TerC
MLDGAPIAYWIGFHLIVIALILSDLFLLNRNATPDGAENGSPAGSSLAFVLFLMALAASFCFWLGHERGRQVALEFASGYLIELSLSVDNLFVFLVMFRAFGLGPLQQRRALSCGVIGAIIMRGIFIFIGISLLRRFAWIQFVFGAFILVAAFRLVRDQKTSAASNRWTSWLTRRGSTNPQRILLYAVIAIELVDLAFALDSIPAVLAVTHEPFIAYTSNIAAILGLRSLYFVLSTLLDRLRFLHYGLAAILAFVGGKMMLTRWVHIPIEISLGVILGTMLIASAASLLCKQTQAKRPSL